LVRYGFERQASLVLFQKPDPTLEKLSSLVERRQDITHMLVQEKNRLQTPGADSRILQSCKSLIEVFEEEITTLSDEINHIIQSVSSLLKKRDILKTIPGIREKVAEPLLSLSLSLGRLTEGISQACVVWRLILVKADKK